LGSTALIFFMQTGFMMLEIGGVREKNAQMVLIKNMLDLGVATIGWLFLGFPLARQQWPPDYTYLFAASAVDWTDFAFSLSFCATCTTIVSGCIAERTLLTAYVVFCAFLSGIIYPMVARSAWSEFGWLSDSPSWAPWLRFHDFAGSAVVHMVGGIAGCVFAACVGPRVGRFNAKEGKTLTYSMTGHSAFLVGSGTMVLWFGWYAFNAGSTKRLSGGYVGVVGRIIVVTTVCPAAAALTCCFKSMVRRQSMASPFTLCNCAISGLVAITAGCDVVPTWASLVIGIVASLLYEGTASLLERMRVDDPLGAVSVHGACGAWGALSVGIFGAPWSAHSASGSQLASQLVGIVAIAAWAAALSLACLVFIDRVTGLRVTLEHELRGMDHELFVGSGEHSAATGTQAPDGRVVIVITDVEGSTRMWVADPTAMSGATVVHDHIMRTEIAAYNGYEITTEGDAFHVAFANSVDAIGFCIAVQRSLLRAKWHPDILKQSEAAVVRLRDGTLVNRGLRIRMALDVGWCKRTLHETSHSFRYKGDAVNMAKGIVDAMDSGGIIAISQRVHEDIAPRISRLGGLITIYDLGGYFVSGNDPEPVDIFAVTHPDIHLRVPLMRELNAHSLVRRGYMQAPGVESLHAALMRAMHTSIRSLRSSSTVLDVDRPKRGTLFSTRHHSPERQLILLLTPVEPVVIVFMSLVSPQKTSRSILPPALDDHEVAERGRRESLEPEMEVGEDDESHTLSARDTIDDGPMDTLVEEGVKLVRFTLDRWGGYECQEDKGVFMLAFEDCHSAVQWSTLVESLVALRWRALLLVSIGMHVDVPTEVRPHGTTGRADYFGTVVNAAARVHSLARKATKIGSSCVYATIAVRRRAEGEAAATDDFEENPISVPLQYTAAGKHALKGFMDQIELVRVKPANSLSSSSAHNCIELSLGQAPHLIRPPSQFQRGRVLTPQSAANAADHPPEKAPDDVGKEGCTNQEFAVV